MAYGGVVRVLICDDEPDIRFLFRDAFERAGAAVEEAGDGEECIQVAARVCPDLVVLDLFMPRRDGLSALVELRDKCPTSPVVIVSAHAAVEVVDRGRALGAAACFDKLGFVPRIPEVLERFGHAA
jgi:CheY-like chemotaxis protein